jgi:transcription elongation GreA/GreB family factor
MIYVVITFPLILLCITVKGHSIKDDPKSMCKAINAGSISGIVLTMIFLLMYIGLRTGNYIMGYIIKLFGYIPPLNMTINPILLTLLNLFNKYKYAPFYVGTLGVLTGYHVGLEVGMKEIPGLIGKIAGLGCPVDLSKKKSNNSIQKQITTELKNIEKNIEKNKNNVEYKELQEFINKTNKNEETEEKTSYTIVGDYEADLSKRKLSLSSPIVRALIGKSEGDSVDVNTPKGIRTYEIYKVNYVELED